MLIYVAASRLDIARAERWMAALRLAGHDITYDWTLDVRKYPVEIDLTDREARDIAMSDATAVRRAEVTWILAPANGGTGVWVEMGIAIACNHPVVVSGPRRSIFSRLAYEFDSDDHAFTFITRSPHA